MSEKPTLLIVDDDSLITDTLSYALGKDFKVLVSDSRRHAVSLLRQLDDAPQLALVDLGLPPMPHRPDEGFALIGDLLAPHQRSDNLPAEAGSRIGRPPRQGRRSPAEPAQVEAYCHFLRTVPKSTSGA